MKHLAFIIIILISLVACSHIDVYEKTAAIPSQAWYYNYIPSFSFTITDTLAVYNIYIVLRHTDAYEYNNIWLRLGTQAPGSDIHFQNLDIVLGSDAKGWEGHGTDDIFEVRKNITRGPVPFKKSGTHTFAINQIMRENPLKHVLNVGIRVEKVGHQ
ncbi:MAG: gliding motility lipoprotein GldH [Ginsengibacter sp.]